jgi:hypothetical protein
VARSGGARTWSIGVLSTALALACAIPAWCQGRMNDKDLENLLRNLRDDAKSFRPVFSSDIHKSTIQKTSREKDAKALADRFEKESEALLNRFEDTKKVDAEVSTVTGTAQQIDSLVRQLGLGPQTTSRWDKIQTELRQISGAFGIQAQFNENPRGISPYDQPAAGPDNGVACTKAMGSERANRLVEECLAVSPGTHPPCNKQNSCILIINEIKRGCSLIGANAPAFCNEYR